MEEFLDPGMGQCREKENKRAVPFSEDNKWRTESAWGVGLFRSQHCLTDRAHGVCSSGCGPQKHSVLEGDA